MSGSEIRVRLGSPGGKALPLCLRSIAAAFRRLPRHGLVDHWLAPVRDLYRAHHEELSRLPSDEARADRVCELNVRAQVASLCHSPIVRAAWERGQKLDVHGWIYRLSDGRLHDLKCATESRVASSG